MTLDELRKHVGAVVVYRPFADVIPERGILGGATADGWAYVWFTGKEAPEKLEPWCITLLHPCGCLCHNATSFANCGCCDN